MSFGTKLRQDAQRVDSRVSVVLTVAGFICSLITLSVYMRLPMVRTTVEARQFHRLLEDYPATGLALILSSLAVVAATKWSKTFWVSVGGFAVACVIALTMSQFFFLSGVFCCLVLLMVIVMHSRQPELFVFVLLIGFFLGIRVTLNFSGSPRAIVSRAQNDMRSISMALNTYRLDHNAFPPSTANPAMHAMWHSDSKMPSFARSWPGGPGTLTTPIAYMAEIPMDVMRLQSEKRTYAYYCSSDGGRSVVISAGVNCVFDLKPEDLDELTSNPLKFVNYQYDPTNGTMSAGDIFRVEPR